MNSSQFKLIEEEMHSTVRVEFSNHLRGFVKQELLLVPLGDRIQDRNHI